MKQYVKKIIVLAIFSTAITAVYSQNKTPDIKPWASEKGYWVVESKIQDPLYHIVRFYNNWNELIHTEYLKDAKLNVDKRKIKMKLKKALEAVVDLYDQHREPEVIRSYVVKILK